MLPFDAAQFWRPPILFFEPRFDSPWLSTLTIFSGFGTSQTPLRRSAEACPSLCNKHAPQEIGPSTRNNITTAIGCEKLSVAQVIIDWYQNTQHGFFFHTQIPLEYVHLLPSASIYPSLMNPTEICTQKSLPNLSGPSHKHSFHHKQKKIGFGDIGFAFGWTINYEETITLDFVDITLQAGCTLPTSNIATHTSQWTINIPLGYDGHTSVFGYIQGALGLYDWLTLECYLAAHGFFNVQRLKCSNFDSQKTELASVHKKPRFAGGLSLKADHMLHGISLQIAYQYHLQGSTTWHKTAISHGWDMHSIQYFIDVDFATFKHPHAPVIGISGTWVVAGHRILDTHMNGIYISTTWRY